MLWQARGWTMRKREQAPAGARASVSAGASTDANLGAHTSGGQAAAGIRGSMAAAGSIAAHAVPRRNLELWYALLAILVVTGLYVLAYLQQNAFPAASGLIGHGIGIVGFLLMLMTATMYTVRKRVTDSRWGSVAKWLKFHMFTGLVGPYMVLLHTSMKFNGVAALATGLTVVVVVSGIVGRYVYTRVPRAVGGMMLSPTAFTASDPELGRRRDELLSRRRAYATWHSIHIPLTWTLFVAAFIHVFVALYYATLQS
jgi:hypothetical protein